MQKPFPQAQLFALLAALFVCGCYSHTGQPYQADREAWHRAAMEACERGDQPAYEALIARADPDAERRHCGDPVDGDHSTTVIED